MAILFLFLLAGSAGEYPPMVILKINGNEQISGIGDNCLKEEQAKKERMMNKIDFKKGKMALDYGVMPLEGLWWTEDMTKFSVENKDIWKWTAMIMQPEFVTKEMLADATRQVEKKKNLPALSKIRFESFFEERTETNSGNVSSFQFVRSSLFILSYQSIEH